MAVGRFLRGGWVVLAAGFPKDLALKILALQEQEQRIFGGRWQSYPPPTPQQLSESWRWDMELLKVLRDETSF